MHKTDNYKRDIPGIDQELQRKAIFKEYSQLGMKKPETNHIQGLVKGNKKTGVAGRIYEHVYVWNIPPIITCPGASKWCEMHCYNFDIRTDVYPINKWRENLWLFHNKKAELRETIICQLKNTKGNCAVRIHSSGDFFSNDYIDFWIEIVKECPDISFWAYTRTWAVRQLAYSLRNLNENENVKLYASYDETMKANPDGRYPLSLVFSDVNEMKDYAEKNNSVICPEQFGVIGSCADCGICMKRDKKNILFLLH